MKFKDENEILALVRSFEEASIGRDEWHHAEHLAVALYYVSRVDLDTATQKMRGGLLNLLREGFGVDFAKEMPFHETLTTFWMRTMHLYSLGADSKSLQEMANDVVCLYDKEYPLRFYTRETLYSERARSTFVEPDLIDADHPSDHFSPI
ncbi:MAG: hypothetical protein WBD22_07710 [Pyrinomonadaceae bacterium]